MSVWVCSHIGGIKNALEKIMPGLMFKEVTGDQIMAMCQDEGPKEESGFLVADNPYFAPILYKKNLPFKFIQSTWAGVDSILRFLEEDRDPEVQVCRFTNDNFSMIMAEYVLGQVLVSERRFRKLNAFQTKEEWASKDPEVKGHKSLRDVKIGVIGLGKMGSQIAKTFKFFGSEVWGFARHVPANLEDRTEVDHYCTSSGPKGLSNLLENCDYVCSVLPRAPHTDNILGNGMFAHCKGAVFINIGRSNVAGEADILEALERGWLREAVLDVFDKEPLPAGHPFWSHPNVVVTPHVAGLSFPQDIALCFKANHERFVSGNALADTVKWNEKY